MKIIFSQEEIREMVLLKCFEAFPDMQLNDFKIALSDDFEFMGVEVEICEVDPDNIIPLQS